MSNQIGIVQLVGPIYSFQGITRQIENAEKDPRVKGLVLYVNSPGGGAFACMEIRRYLDNMSKPNVAVMDEVGASGAYYIASAADDLMAHANTLTGSVGVISIWEDYSEWLENEGIKYWVWKTGEAKDLYEPWRSPTQEENRTIQKRLNETYEVLISDIASGRPNMTVEEVRNVANGSLYTGLEAFQLGLIDEIGDYSQAVDSLASRRKLRGYMTRDMSKGDRMVLASLMVSYLLSDATVLLAVILFALIVVRFLTKRKEEQEQEGLRTGI